MQIKNIWVVIGSILVSGQSWAKAPADLVDFQFGGTWDRTLLSQVSDPVVAQVAKSVARSGKAGGGSTAIYLGKIAGLHVMATNDHVIRSQKCQQLLRFSDIDHDFPCEKELGNWSNVEFALFSITVPTEFESALAGRGLRFAFDEPIAHDQPLVTVGYGSSRNSVQTEPTVDLGTDCRVLSDWNEFEDMLQNEGGVGPGQAYSFSIGCDASMGDSGSPVVAHDTGKLLGILWDVGFPKSPQVQSSYYLPWLLQIQDADTIWKQATYAVPAAKIFEVLSGQLTGGQISDPVSQAVIAELLGASIEN